LRGGARGWREGMVGCFAWVDIVMEFSCSSSSMLFLRGEGPKVSVETCSEGLEVAFGFIRLGCP